MIWHEAGVLPRQLRMKRCPKAAAGQQLWEQWGMGGQEQRVGGTSLQELLLMRKVDIIGQIGK